MVLRPLDRIIDALRLMLDDPRGKACEIDEAAFILTCRPPSGSPIVALWAPDAEAELESAGRILARLNQPLAYMVVLWSGRIPDRLLLNPPPSPPKWIFAADCGGSTQLAAWGGSIDPALGELLNPARAESALRHVRQELERHFADLSQLYFTPDALTSAALTPDMLANAVRIVVEREPAWRLLDVDGRSVVTRLPPGVPLTSLWRRICGALSGRHLKLAQAARQARALDEARLVLAVRGDRITEQLDTLRQSEWRQAAEGRAAHDSSRRAAIAGRVAELRREVRRLTARLEIMQSQRTIVETHLHHIDLQRIAGAVRLPSAAELATQAAAAAALLAQVRDAAALARSADEAVLAQTGVSTGDVDAVLAELSPSRPTSEHSAPGAQTALGAADGDESRARRRPADEEPPLAAAQ